MICSKCDVDQSLESFHIDRTAKMGRRADCRSCHTEVSRARYRFNREARLTQQKQYRADNRDQIRARQRKYYTDNLQFKLGACLRSRLNSALKDGYKAGSAVRDLGCTIEEFKQHLENHFQDGMTWENWTLGGWHIDHVKPLSGFDLTDVSELQQACHWSNLQPMWARDNLSKGNKEL